MQRFATLLTLGLLLAGPASAQLNRAAGDSQDVIWARDIGSASITLDGMLDEAVWSQAETIQIQWDDPLGFPGSGQGFDRNPNEFDTPPDPVNATVSFLRKGNDLYVAVDAQDQSVGGSGLFNMDGVFMTLINKFDRPDDFTEIDDNFSSTREELFYSWWLRGRDQDTTATGAPLPGISPWGYSSAFGSGYDDSLRVDLNTEAFDFASTVDGVANDDYNGNAAATPDNGYILEFMVSVDSLGWDLTQAMSRMPMSIAIQDADYNWPQEANPGQYSSARAFWQNQWANTLTPGGAAYIAGDPSVTVDSGALPAYSTPEFVVANANNTPEPTIDGQLDEPAWSGVEPQFTLQYKATPDELDAGLPGVLSPYYNFYFHPDENEVLDPTEGRITMFYRGSKLYLGLDTDDQAVNGSSGESGRDGFRFLLRSRDSTSGAWEYQATHLRFDTYVDSTGTLQFSNISDEVEVGTDLVGAAFLKGSTTAANPTDIDSGYQIEVALDLTAIGYPADLDGESIWASVNFFDGDALADDSQSYSTRTWSPGERTNGAILRGYLDANAFVTADESGPGLFEGLRVVGSHPNPTTGAATIRYELPRAASVTVEVFDVLGRTVQTVETGLQPAGLRSVAIDATGLSTGAYVYRVRLDDGTSATGRMLIAR